MRSDRDILEEKSRLIMEEQGRIEDQLKASKEKTEQMVGEINSLTTQRDELQQQNETLEQKNEDTNQKLKESEACVAELRTQQDELKG